MKRRVQNRFAVSVALALFSVPSLAQDTRVLIVVGLGGDPEYRATFHERAKALREAALDRFGVDPAHVVYLGERPEQDPELIRDRSTKEAMGVVLAEMAEQAAPRDRILIVLIGHGSGQEDSAVFNLPGPDLSPGELNAMLREFPSQVVAVVNTAPSSGPFVEGLSGPNRIVVTATRTAQERNETQFGAFFVKALEADGIDQDKDDRISLLETFLYAQREVERYYEELNLLATEHSQLDDDGDGVGSSDLGEDATDGWLARGFWLRSEPLSGLGAVPTEVTDPELRRLFEERLALERRIAELRALRGQMEEAQYERELEELLVALALKTREIREKGGGGE